MTKITKLEFQIVLSEHIFVQQYWVFCGESYKRHELDVTSAVQYMK